MKNVLLGLVAVGLFAISATAVRAADPSQQNGFNIHEFAKSIQLDKPQATELAHGGGHGHGGHGHGGGYGGGYGGHGGHHHGHYHPPVCYPRYYPTYPSYYPYGGGGGVSLYGPRGGLTIRF